MKILVIISVIAIVVVHHHEAANILCAIVVPYKSHFVVFNRIALELAKRGHNVTMLSVSSHTVSNKPPNYQQVLLEVPHIYEGMNFFNEVERRGNEEFMDEYLWRGELGRVKLTLQSKQFQEFIKKDNKFDLVIVEQFNQDAFNMLAHKYNTPLVLVSVYGNCMKHNIVTRNPLQLPTVITEFMFIDGPTSFLGRLKNFYLTTYEFILWKYWLLEKHEELARRYIPGLPEPVPNLYSIQMNASLALINRHFTLQPAVAYLPNLVEVGGLHLCESNSTLPKDLQELLDKAVEGVVYVNFGSITLLKHMPENKRTVFFNVFTHLHHLLFLVKWEDDILVDQPINVVVRKWFPQLEILAHPNVKLFLTHGGLMSIEEAVFHGVPILGCPIFGDQFNNVLLLQEIGYGKLIRLNDLHEHILEDDIKDMVKNISYKNTAVEVSARFKDRPIDALKTAIFWIEYVMRHRGAKFMKNPARNMSWIAYNMIDVYSFVGFSFLITLFYLIKTVALTKNAVNTIFMNKKVKLH